MADSKAKRKFWKKPIGISKDRVELGIGDMLKLNVTGIKRTDSYGNPVAIVDKSGQRFEPGFTPDSVYAVEESSDNLAPNGWYGHLIDAHFDSENFAKMKKISAQKKYNDKRDTLQQFGDWRTDYFIHDNQINQNSPILMTDGLRNAPYTMFSNPSKYHTSYENQDPVIYAFDIIIDALSSPLLNGSISDFLALYPNVSELQSRRIVYHDFKKQFEKIFKTKGTIHYEPGYNPGPLMSDRQNGSLLSGQAEAAATGQRLTRGKKAYLGHYLYKIEGLDKLVEANTGAENNYLVDYGKDLIKLTFTEDVTGTLSALAHMYKLLYWSRPNGKGLVPENLLRFNCDIVVYEMRNFNRIRPAMASDGNSTGKLETLRDNVSRYIYSLKECQFYFDKMAHDSIIDMGGTPKTFDAFDVSFDFKYSTLKYEKWVSDPNLFGKYVGYNNGAIWKVGNKGARLSQNFTVGREDNTTDQTVAGNTGTVRDSSVPVFYTSDTNSLGEPGVKEIERIKTYINDPVKEELTKKKDTAPADTKAKDVDQTVSAPTTVAASNEDGQGKTQDNGEKEESFFDKFKEKSKKGAAKLAKKTANFFIDEVNNQINIRVQIINNTINNIRNAVGLSGLATEPRNVYPKPYVPYSFGIFFDVRNELYNFAGEGISSALAGFGNVLDPYQDPMNPSLNPFGSIVQKFSSAPTVLKNNAMAGPQTLQAIIKKYGGK